MKEQGWRLWRRWGDRFTIANLDDQDDQLVILDRVEDPVISFPNMAERVFADKFLHPLRTWIMLQPLHPLDEAFLDRWSAGSKLAFSRREEEDRVSHREGLETKVLQNHSQRFGSPFLRFGQRSPRISQVNTIFQES